MQSLVTDLINALSSHGFCPVVDIQKDIPEACILLKRQTWVTNRAVVVVELPEVPKDFAQYIATLRKRVAFRCGFFPFFYGIGIQVIVTAPGISDSALSPSNHIARVDNQWAIVQSLFFVDTINQRCVSSHTWGQFITGKFQDAIAEVLTKRYLQK